MNLCVAMMRCPGEKTFILRCAAEDVSVCLDVMEGLGYLPSSFGGQVLFCAEKEVTSASEEERLWLQFIERAQRIGLANFANQTFRRWRDGAVNFWANGDNQTADGKNLFSVYLQDGCSMVTYVDPETHSFPTVH